MADLTAAEEKILQQAEWVEELKRSEGWRVLKERLEYGLEAIKKSKVSLATTDWKQDETTGEIIFEGDISFEKIGRQYMQLDERRIAFEGVLAEPDVIIRQAKAIRERLAKEPPK